MEKQINNFLEFLQKDKKLTDNTLQSYKRDINQYEGCTTLIDDGILDSFAILSIVSELQDEFDITITPADIIPDNFNSAKALWDMVCRLKG